MSDGARIALLSDGVPGGDCTGDDAGRDRSPDSGDDDLPNDSDDARGTTLRGMVGSDRLAQCARPTQERGMIPTTPFSRCSASMERCFACPIVCSTAAITASALRPSGSRKVMSQLLTGSILCMITAGFLIVNDPPPFRR